MTEKHCALTTSSPLAQSIALNPMSQENLLKYKVLTEKKPFENTFLSVLLQQGTLLNLTISTEDMLFLWK